MSRIWFNDNTLGIIKKAKLSHDKKEQSDGYKKICKETDEKIEQYHKKLGRAYIRSNNFIARNNK